MSVSVLHSAREFVSSAKNINASGTKVYKHLVPNSRFVLPDGSSIIFLGGMYATDNKEHIAELDKIVDQPASMLYTTKVSDELTKLIEKSVLDARES